MSYILDALRKSEQRRPPGPVPDLFSVQGPQAPERRRLSGRALAASLAAGGAVAVAVWVWLGGPGGDAPRAPAPRAEAARPIGEATPAAEPLPAPSQATGGVREAASGGAAATGSARERRARETGATRRELSVALPLPAPIAAPIAAPEPARRPAIAPMPGTAAPPAPVAGPAPATEPPVPAQPPAAPEVAVSRPQPPAPPVEPAAPLAAPAAPPEPAAPDGRVVDLAALPPSVRGDLPPLEISGHVWSEEPALRLLTVQDRIVREGGEAAPGVRLEEITQSGAVLVYRGWRFRVAGY